MIGNDALDIIQSGACDRQRRQLISLSRRIEQPPVLAIAGQTNVGKSTLFNAIGLAFFGSPLAPMSAGTCTDCPTLYRYGPRRRILAWTSDEEEDGEPAFASEYSDAVTQLKELSEIGDMTSSSGRFSRIAVELPIEYLSRVHLLDLPGDNSPADRHADLSRVCAEADGVLFCLNAQNPGHEKNLDMLEFIAEQRGGPVWGVLTRHDGHESPVREIMDAGWWQNFEHCFEPWPLQEFRVERALPVQGKLALGIQTCSDAELTAIKRLRQRIGDPHRWTQLTSRTKRQRAFASDQYTTEFGLSPEQRADLLARFGLAGIGRIGELFAEDIRVEAMPNRIMSESGLNTVGALLDFLASKEGRAKRVQAIERRYCVLASSVLKQWRDSAAVLQDWIAKNDTTGRSELAATDPSAKYSPTDDPFDAFSSP